MLLRFVVSLGVFLLLSTPVWGEFDHFITIKDGALMEGERPFRFLSFNVPTLNYVEDNMAFEQTNPYALPSEFELRDLYKTINAMGGRVVRSYTIPVFNKNFPKAAPTYVEAPGKFNEAAFKSMDLALALAKQYGIRVVVPLLNNWQWMGGRPNYADFRGKHEDLFWTDRQLIEDFKKTIHYVLNRTNTITGVKYKDDKTIMGWETGNELQNPPEWGIDIARYIKSIDDKHLVIDGFHAIHMENHHVWVQQYSIDEPAIDMINTHHYEVSPRQMIEDLKKTVAMVGGKKPVFLGEFGFISTSGLEAVVDYIISEPAIPGAFIWSLRRHHPEGGFYHHSEPLGYGLYRAYHWPGHDDGKVYDERDFLWMYRQKAFEIQGRRAPPIASPEPPKLLPFHSSPQFSWQGSMGAAGYNIERSEKKEGPYDVIAYNVDDIGTPGFPLYSDEAAVVGGTYYYRIVALNRAGASLPSNVVGPIKVAHLTRVDKAENLGTLFESKGLTVKTGDYRSFKEAYSRLSGGKGAEIIYYSPGKFLQFELSAYEKSESPSLSLTVSSDGENYRTVKSTPTNYALAESNYDYWIPRKYQIRDEQGEVRFIKIEFEADAQIVRAELDYR